MKRDVACRACKIFASTTPLIHIPEVGLYIAYFGKEVCVTLLFHQLAAHTFFVDVVCPDTHTQRPLIRLSSPLILTF